MLCFMVVAGVLADAIQLPGIVGAFLAGLAVNASARDKPASVKLQFLGKSLFIPIFFIATGFLIDPVAFVHDIVDNFPLVASIVGALLIGKGIAAWVVGRAFGYSRDERLVVWSLTLPQVAATLAATLVAHETFDAGGQRLLDDQMLNAVLVLMLTTSILGPVLTERFAPRLVPSKTHSGGPSSSRPVASETWSFGAQIQRRVSASVEAGRFPDLDPIGPLALRLPWSDGVPTPSTDR